MRELAFTIACACALVCLLLPASWHMRSKNSGTLLYLGWSFTGNFIYFVNSIVWNGNIGNPSPVWCDIASKLMIGLTVGLPCAGLCIQRRLYAVSRVESMDNSREQQRRQVIIDLLIGLGIPSMVMASRESSARGRAPFSVLLFLSLTTIADFVVQGHRFDIYEDFGCWPTIYFSGPAIALVLIWPMIVSLISIPYCVMSWRSFNRRRAEFRKYLAQSDPGLTVDRYLRLMALASMEIVFVLPLNAFSLIVNCMTQPLLPYTSWEDVHWNWNRVRFFTNFVLESNKKFFIGQQIGRWTIPVTGFLFFIFFGMSVEARKDYRAMANFFLKPFGVQLQPQPPQNRGSRSFLDRLLKRKSTGSAREPFANDNTLTDLPTPTSRRTRRDTLSSLASSTSGSSKHTITGDKTAVPPLRIPDAIYSPTYRSHGVRPSMSSDLSDLDDSSCGHGHARASSTSHLLFSSPATATSASSAPWELKPLPAIPSSRPVSTATTIMPPPAATAASRPNAALDPVVDEDVPSHDQVDAMELGSRRHSQADGSESVYYTPATYRLSLASAEYQPSIPEIPGAWQPSARKTTKGKRARANPFL